MPDGQGTAQAVQLGSAGQATITELLGLQKRDTDAIAALAFQLYHQGRVRDAEAIFKGLIALDSHVYFGYAGLGAMALAEEKLEHAVENYRQAAKLLPNDPTVHANLGEALLRQARFGEAAAEFKKSIELDPQELDPGANRARAIITGIQYVIAGMERIAGK